MKQAKPFILPFSEIRATDLPLVGGKGANLGELTQARFPIPTGFCVTTAAFTQFMTSYSEVDSLYRQLKGITLADIDLARQVGQHVRESLLTVPMPSFFAEKIVATWQTLGMNEAYAVRSSATAEDLPDASFAGQQDTYLNVVGEAVLLDAVRRCWVSLFTDRAILYRIQNNFSHEDVQLAVIVQQMIMSETSGILFTADPLTGHRHTATIDASFGLGEALVSGLVSPDAYRVDKRSLTIIEKQVSDKQIAIYPEKDGGVRQVDLTESQRSQTVLSDDQIIQLTKLGIQIEAHYGIPQDIEWGIADDNLYLLQARPITSLFPIDNLQSPDDSLHIFFSLGHQQMMTDVMSPLSISNMKVILPLGHENGVIESSIIRANGGRMFADLTRILRHPILYRLPMAILSQFDALAPALLRKGMSRPEFKGAHGVSLSFSTLRFVRQAIGSILSTLWWEDLTGFVHRADKALDKSVHKAAKTLAKAMTSESKIETSIHVLRTVYQAPLFWLPKFAAGTIADRLINRLAKNWEVDDALAAYNLGLSGNAVNEMNLAIGDLADIARQSSKLEKHFSNLGQTSVEWLEQARLIEGSDPFFQAWDAFLVRYGCRGASEIDIRALRWYEEPLPLLQVIASFLQKEPGSHRKQHEQLVAGRKAAVSTLLNKANRGVLGPLRVRFLRRLLHVAHEGGVLREHHKFYIIQINRLIKEGVKETAVQLIKENKLKQLDDVWFFTWPELLALTKGELPDAVEMIHQRQAEYERYQKLTPPVVITSDGEAPIVKYVVEDAPEGALVGNPVSPGVVEGNVHVIHDPQAETLAAGDILVATFTDPGWTPLFINAGGLIMEVGGAMTHGSVVAREYGIPAIVGVREATTTLQTGQRVRIDGNRGIIEILHTKQ